MNNMNSRDLMKKTMNKRKLRVYYNAARSPVGMGQKLGTRSMRSAHDYRREKEKRVLREICADN